MKIIILLKCGGNMYIILVYDIVITDRYGARILNNIFKICKQYLTHIQKSVFEGELTETLLQELKYKINQYIRKDRDSVIIFEISNTKKLHKTILGIDNDKTSNFF